MQRSTSSSCSSAQIGYLSPPRGQTSLSRLNPDLLTRGFFVLKRRLHCNGGIRTNLIVDTDPVSHAATAASRGQPFSVTVPRGVESLAVATFNRGLNASCGFIAARERRYSRLRSLRRQFLRRKVWITAQRNRHCRQVSDSCLCLSSAQTGQLPRFPLAEEVPAGSHTAERSQKKPRKGRSFFRDKPIIYARIFQPDF